jgi:hypothetical protein
MHDRVESLIAADSAGLNRCEHGELRQGKISDMRSTVFGIGTASA